MIQGIHCTCIGYTAYLFEVRALSHLSSERENSFAPFSRHPIPSLALQPLREISWRRQNMFFASSIASQLLFDLGLTNRKTQISRGGVVRKRQCSCCFSTAMLLHHVLPLMSTWKAIKTNPLVCLSAFRGILFSDSVPPCSGL